MKPISLYQLFILTLLFQIGSSVIFGFASAAGRDAWLASLITTPIGVTLIIIYASIAKLQPQLTLVEWFPSLLGRWIGTPLAWFYSLLFIYNASRTLGDIKDLIPTTILPGTPNWIILGVFMIAIVYALVSGIEVIARIGEMILPFLLLLFTIEIILLLGSDMLRIERLQPVLGEGWGRIWEAVWPTGIQQSYGETLEFAMIWTLVKTGRSVGKTTLYATVIYGLFISIFDALAILAFGEGVFSSSTYPLYRLVKIITIGDFLENLDALGILYFIATAFFKVTLQLYGAIRGIQILLYLNHTRIIVMIVTAITLYLGLTESRNTAEHLASGLKSLGNPGLLIYVGVPILLLLVALVRKMMNQKTNQYQ